MQDQPTHVTRSDFDALLNRVAEVEKQLTALASPPRYGLPRVAPLRSNEDDLESRAHFFWTSGSLFLEALGRHPSIADRAHASGPGRTATTIRETLGPNARLSIWLDYEQWQRHLTS